MTFGRRPPGWHECWQRSVAGKAEGLRNSSNNCCGNVCHQRRGGVSEGGMSGRKSETNREIRRTGGASAAGEPEVGGDRSSDEALVMRVERRVPALWMRAGEGKER
jgi:hypothetical protein